MAIASSGKTEHTSKTQLIGLFMRLNLFTDYALRLLIQVATADPNLLTTATAAKSYGISRNHLTKIANELVRGGYLHAVRGRSGGLRLAKKAELINVGDIFRFCETGAPLVECFDSTTNKCVITPACSLKHILFDANEAFIAILAKYTLADLIKHRTELQKLLR
jgi:Rrf2 family transcriptional regulator, nitric oxide-sensitive transcriptional repressor